MGKHLTICRSEISTQLPTVGRPVMPAWCVAGSLLAATVLMGAHYSFGEWLFFPDVTLSQEPLFWSDLGWYVVLPGMTWIVCKAVSRGGMSVHRLLLAACIVLCAGDLLTYLVFQRLYPHVRELLELQRPPNYKEWWTQWLPTVGGVTGLLILRLWFLGCPHSERAGEKAASVSAGPWGRRCWALITSGVTAVGLIGLYLALPRMPLNNTTVWLAEEILVSTEHWKDFAYITKNPTCYGKSLGTLLDHVKLAHLHRAQFYAHLEDTWFRDYVLSPYVSELPLMEFNWRPALRDYLWPHLQRERDPWNGAQLVVRLLRERVGIDETYACRVGVETIWTQQMTDPAGFERLSVAALRSVGIAARLAKGKAQLWTGKEWRPIPLPLDNFK